MLLHLSSHWSRVHNVPIRQDKACTGAGYGRTFYALFGCLQARFPSKLPLIKHCPTVPDSRLLPMLSTEAATSRLPAAHMQDYLTRVKRRAGQRLTAHPDDDQPQTR